VLRLRVVSPKTGRADRSSRHQDRHRRRRTVRWTTERSCTTVSGVGDLRVLSSGAGPPVVLLHAFTFDVTMWHDLAARLQPEHTVVRYDQRGFGASPDPVGSYSDVTDLWQVMDRQRIEQAVLVGASMGGGLALEAALCDPGRVGGLVLIGPNLPGGAGDAEFGRWWRRLEETARSEGVDAAKQLWLAHPLFGFSGGTAAARQRLAVLTQAYRGFHWLHQDPREEIEPAAATRLGEVEAPTLVLVGDHETALITGYADTITEQVPNAGLEVVRDAGHMVGLDAPEHTAAVVASFLTSIDLGTPEQVQN
jgi:pimeloyl-ACP methyl ester carboxylesterase